MVLFNPIFCLDMNFQRFQRVMSASKHCPMKGAQMKWEVKGSEECFMMEH